MKIEMNKVYNCDCLDLMRSMVEQNIKVDAVITDPPYLMSYKSNHRKEKSHKFCQEIIGDHDSTLIHEYIKLCYDIMKDDTPLYCFCNSNKIDIFKQEIEQANFTIKNIIIWVKNNWTAGDLEAQFGKQYEMIIYANKGRAKFVGGRKTDVWYDKRVVGEEQMHQNQKPTDLIMKILNISTTKNDIVFDGFMGSFTTAVACHKTQRRFIGAELDKEYYDLGNKRLEKVQSQLSMFDLL